MNGKRAKQLRRAARSMTEGRPDVEYQPYRHYKDTKQLNDTCTKAVGKKLKEGYKQAAK